MFKRRKILFKDNFEVYLISCGDTGEQIGNGIIQTLKESGAQVKSLLVSTGKLSKKESGFNDTFSINENRDGFSKILSDAMDELETRKEDLKSKLAKVVPSDRNKLLIVTTGAGATGLGSTLTILDILYEEYKLIPPVITLLPEVFENSRIQNNVAVFLYRLIYKDTSRGNSVLILDNKPALDELDTPFSTLSENRLSKIPIAVGDLLFSSFQKTITEDFDSNVADLMEVMHTPGISVFVAEVLGTEIGKANSNLSSVIVDSVTKTTSLEEDKVFEAKSTFIAVSNITDLDNQLSRQTIIEAQKIERRFVSRPYMKFIETGDDDPPMIHAIVAGLPRPPRILQIMQLGRDMRKDVLFNEYELSNELYDLNINKIIHLEEERDSIIG